MPREPRYLVQVRQPEEPWRTLWSGAGLDIAHLAATGLAAETREMSGGGRRLPVHAYVRVALADKPVALWVYGRPREGA